MKRIIRERQLTPAKAAQNQAIREQVAQELPDLIAHHQERRVHSPMGDIPNEAQSRSD